MLGEYFKIECAVQFIYVPFIVCGSTYIVYCWYAFVL